MILKQNQAQQRRSSLHNLSSGSHLSMDPQLNRRSSLDYITLNIYPPGSSDFSVPHDRHSQSLGTINKLHMQSPTNLKRAGSSSLDVHIHQSSHNSNSHISAQGSNSSLSDLQSQSHLHSFPTFPSPDEIPFNERSKSLGNIFTSVVQRPLQHAVSYPMREGHFQTGPRQHKRPLTTTLSRNAHKKPR